jgi:hypothetical protein
LRDAIKENQTVANQSLGSALNSLSKKAEIAKAGDEGQPIEVSLATINEIQAAVEMKQNPFARFVMTLKSEFSIQKTLDEKIKEVLGEDSIKSSGGIEQRGNIVDPLSSRALAGAA